MNEKELDIELDKIYEEGDKIFIPKTLISEIFSLMVKTELKKVTD